MRNQGDQNQNHESPLISRLVDWVAMPERMHGASVTENELSEIFGVSRTPLREALNFASAIRLVERERNRPIKVPALSVQDMLQLSLTREALEGLITFQAVEHVVAGEASLAELEKINQRMKALAKIGDTEALLATGRDFHHFIRVHSGNPVASMMLRQLMLRIERYRQCIRSMPKRTALIVHEHEVILAAFRDGDPAAAAKAAQQHVTNAREYYRSALAKHALL